jgi:hypothetical protein
MELVETMVGALLHTTKKAKYAKMDPKPWAYLIVAISCHPQKERKSLSEIR